MSVDTICALATAPGGAIGIVRISGNETLEILSRVFTKDLTNAQPNTIHYGHIKNGEETIDEVLVSVFRAPHSYTGEESAEISCHGSRYILNKVLALLIANGCRQAGPGEFTQRAYLNGKMDLSQAEAVADLIASTNQATHQIAMSQLRGHFSSKLAQLREQLLKLTSLLDLRYREAEQVEEMFAKNLGLDLTIARAAQKFYAALKGLDEPEAKRKAIGKTFIDVFAEEARRFRHCRFLGQGTIYPDVIESSSATKKGPSQTIKSHHNVGGLPPDLKFELVEPLRDLFKDEVRAVGRVMGMADELLDRQPFPGPGLGVRILGEVTKEKVEMLQQADVRTSSARLMWCPMQSLLQDWLMT